MATKLKKMKLTSVDLVRAGANQEADICLFKSADPPEAAESPTEKETNIFKRFIHWLRENPTEAESEPHSHIEKTEDEPDLEYLYKSVLAESLYSIMTDDTLTDIEKKDMTEESLRQYNDKIRELEDFDEDYGGGGDIDEKLLEQIDNFDKDDDTIEEEIIEETDDWDDDDQDDDDRYELIEEVSLRKFNPYHGRDGRFSSSNGGGGGSVTWHTTGAGSATRQDGKIGRNAMLDKPKSQTIYTQTSSGGVGGSTGTSPASAAMRRFSEQATGTVHTYNSDGKLVSSKPGGMSGGGAKDNRLITAGRTANFDAVGGKYKSGGLNDKAKEILRSGGASKAYKVADLVGEMKLGDSVTCKDYRKGDIMEFKKVGNADTISAFQNVRGKNHMASPQQVKSWVKDSVLYADYNPTFKESAN